MINRKQHDILLEQFDKRSNKDEVKFDLKKKKNKYKYTQKKKSYNDSNKDYFKYPKTNKGSDEFNDESNEDSD